MMNNHINMEDMEYTLYKEITQKEKDDKLHTYRLYISYNGEAYIDVYEDNGKWSMQGCTCDIVDQWNNMLKWSI